MLVCYNSKITKSSKFSTQTPQTNPPHKFCVDTKFQFSGAHLLLSLIFFLQISILCWTRGKRRWKLNGEFLMLWHWGFVMLCSNKQLNLFSYVLRIANNDFFPRSRFFMYGFFFYFYLFRDDEGRKPFESCLITTIYVYVMHALLLTQKFPPITFCYIIKAAKWQKYFFLKWQFLCCMSVRLSSWMHERRKMEKN